MLKPSSWDNQVPFKATGSIREEDHVDRAMLGVFAGTGRGGPETCPAVQNQCMRQPWENL
jgi:hypothetical protein